MSKSFVEYLEEQCEPKMNKKEIYTKLLEFYRLKIGDVIDIYNEKRNYVD